MGRLLIKASILFAFLLISFPTKAKADELLTINATAYCVTGTTATGTQTTEGRTLAGHPDWYGKKAFVWLDKGNGIQEENFIGQFTVEDTGKKGGSVRNGETVDIYMTDYDRCIRFGRQNVFVYLMDAGVF